MKALFLADNSEYTKVFISNDNELVRKLQGEGYTAYTKYSLKGIFYAIRAGIYVYSGYPSDINFWLSGGAKYVNVWHGTPIKKIERDVSTGYYSSRNRYEWFYKLVAPHLLVKPDTMLVSSMYEEKCFKSAFDVRENLFVRAFPPRLKALVTYGKGKGIAANILYVPTWRDDHSFQFEDYVDLCKFNGFLKNNNLKLYIKLHPSDESIGLGEDYSNIITIDKNEDVYTFLKDTDILVSDYSSMIFESLYLSKPVVIFCPDYTFYQLGSREFYLDPCKDLPVEVSFTQSELEKCILLSLRGRSYDLAQPESFRPYSIQQQLLRLLVVK